MGLQSWQPYVRWDLTSVRYNVFLTLGGSEAENALLSRLSLE